MADIFNFYTKLLFLLAICCPIGSKRQDPCATPPVPANGRISKLKHLKQAKIAWYKCSVGYIRYGPEFRVCREGRGWSASVKCGLPATTPSTPMPQLKKDMNNKFQTTVKEVEESNVGKVAAIAIGSGVLLGLLLAVHCYRVILTKKSLKSKYDEVVAAGDNPSRELPTTMEVSNAMFKTTLCCDDSDLPKSFKKKKKKKKKKDLDEKTGLIKDVNMNRATEHSRDRDFQSEAGYRLFTSNISQGRQSEEESDIN